jgi:hypothetical protein
VGYGTKHTLGIGTLINGKKRFECLRKTLKGWNLNIEGEYMKEIGDLATQLDEIDNKGAIWPNTRRNS